MHTFNSDRSAATRSRSIASAILGTLCLLLGACASTPPAPEQEEGDYWSYSRVVDTDESMISLFDPVDLQHHASDPADWYKYDFAFLDDMSTGRFIALVTGSNGRHSIKITNAPLSEDERAVAGPNATLRLRVLNERLLLSGGSAWPSASRSMTVAMRSAASDRHWLYLPNGDYKVTATALDSLGLNVHDYVLQLEPVDSIAEVEHAPGIPHLRPGDRIAGVAGVNAGGVSYKERCTAVPQLAELSPLLTRSLPLPGGYGEIEVSANLHARGRALQDAGLRADLPIVVAREAAVGSLGVYVQPARWTRVGTDEYGRARHAVLGRALCTVRITAVESGAQGRVLGIQPVPSSKDVLTRTLAREIAAQFDTWLRVSNDPAYRFKSAYVQRARDSRSLLFGVMQNLGLPASELETLLLKNNETRARRVLELMREPSI